MLSRDLLIFNLGSICTLKSPNRAKSNHGFHRKLKGDLNNLMAIVDFDYLQAINWGQNWTKNLHFGYALPLEKFKVLKIL